MSSAHLGPKPQMETPSLVEFYRQHSISPVRQDLSNMGKHFERREALYWHLGILPAFVRGRTVLEVGPGSGCNSLYTASLNPSRYVLLEGNPKGVEDIARLFAGYPDLHARVEVAQCLLQEYDSDERFDFVFCEGVLSGVFDPQETLQQVARFVAPDGVLIITCIDHISYFPDTLRRLCAQRLIDSEASVEAQTAVLLPIFRHHLARLPDMSRSHEDWIIDNVINPASIGPLLSIPEAIAAIAEAFEILGSSPRFMTDWRWYKTITGSRRDFNTIALEQYWQSAHNFLEYSTLLPPRPAPLNRQLHERCRTMRDAIRAFERTRDEQLLEDLCRVLNEVIALIEAFSGQAAEALREVERWLSQPAPAPDALAESEAFGGLFGRGQQYLSFSRRKGA